VEGLSVYILAGNAVDELTKVMSISSCEGVRFKRADNIPVTLQGSPSDNKIIGVFHATPAASIRCKERGKSGVEFVRKKKEMKKEYSSHSHTSVISNYCTNLGFVAATCFGHLF